MRSLIQIVLIGCLVAVHLAGKAYAFIDTEPDAHTPDWAKEAVWYQIFVERFRNGDQENDPTLEDMKGSWPHVSPTGWEPTPWTHDWYEQEEWAAAMGEDFYYTVQLRRYGGDLWGVWDKLDYLQELGITAIYFNPLNDAPSLHKYDARNYRHIDQNFGPDPRGDEKIIAAEDPIDPNTWQWTSADSLFLKLIEEIHRREMRLIMDYSWNHTGLTFWAWRDVLDKQEKSAFADWYQITRFDNPDTPPNEFWYVGWAGVKELPNLTKIGVPPGYHGGPSEGDLHPEVKRHVLSVTKRWLDPDGDGNPSDGVDGFRLDVAEMVPLGFWRDYRTFVKSINPEAYLVGEIWWEKWPDRMMDPRPYLGDCFDGVMNYRWYMSTRSLVGHALPFFTPTTYISHLDSIESGIARENLLAMMNVAATHDSPRLATSLYNAGPYKVNVKPKDDPSYKVEKPDAHTRAIKKLLLVQQFSYYGAPHIWYGDEIGMWGADDPDCRKPMIWDDLVYENEDDSPDGPRNFSDPVQSDQELLTFYRNLISMRKQHIDLFVYGDLEYVPMDDKSGLLAYTRTRDDQQAVVLINTSDSMHFVDIPCGGAGYIDGLNPDFRARSIEGRLTFKIKPISAAILFRK